MGCYIHYYSRVYIGTVPYLKILTDGAHKLKFCDTLYHDVRNVGYIGDISSFGYYRAELLDFVKEEGKKLKG